jgi:hypothetical protein
MHTDTDILHLYPIYLLIFKCHVLDSKVKVEPEALH